MVMDSALLQFGSIPRSHVIYIQQAYRFLQTGQVPPEQYRRQFLMFVDTLVRQIYRNPVLLRLLLHTPHMREHMEQETLDEASTGVKPAVSLSNQIKDRVAADLAKHKAKKAEALAAAKDELGKATIDAKAARKNIFRKEEVELDEASTGTKSSISHSDDIKARVAADIAKRKAAKAAALSSAKSELDKHTVDVKAAKKNIFRKEEAVHEEIQLSKAPEAMLMTFAKIVKQKMRAGGRPTDADKKLVTRAKNELRRRRNLEAKRGLPEETKTEE